MANTRRARQAPASDGQIDAYEQEKRTRPARIAAAKARRAEAADEPLLIEFDYDGDRYTITRENADDLELYEAIEDEKYLTAVRGFLGPEQWAAFKDRHREGGRVKASALEPFLELLMEKIGQGNSSASPS